MRGLKSTALAVTAGMLALSPMAQAEVLPFSYSGAVTDSSDSNPATVTSIEMTFNNPSQVLTFQGLNDGSLTLTSVDYNFSFSLDTELDVVSDGSPFALVNDTVQANSAFAIAGGATVLSAGADGAANLFSYLGSPQPAGPQHLTPTSTFNSSVNGTLVDAATLAAFTSNATVDVTIDSVFSNSFFDLGTGAISFAGFDPFVVSGNLELTFNTVAAPIPGSVALLAAGLGLLSFRFKRKAA